MSQKNDTLRILITGGPRTGKSTLADTMGRELGIPVKHTDDLIGTLDWSAGSAKVAEWMSEPGPWIIEGVSIARALRKWMKANPAMSDAPPADRLIRLTREWEPLSPGQAAMAKGCNTVWNEISLDVMKRGVSVETRE